MHVLSFPLKNLLLNALTKKKQKCKSTLFLFIKVHLLFNIEQNKKISFNFHEVLGYYQKTYS